MKTIRSALLTVVFFLGGTCVSAQTTNATLSGIVYDSLHAVIPHALVKIRNVATGTLRTAITDDAGRYSTSSLPPGSYELQVEKAGYRTTVINGLALVVGGSEVVDVSLPVGNIDQEVLIISETDNAALEDVGVGRVIGLSEITFLPIGGRNFVDFARLSSGVVLGRENVGGGSFKEPDAGVGASAVPRLSFGGQSELNTMVQVDGVDNIQTLTGLPRATPSMEAVLEFRIVNSPYLAEYGRALGGFLNIVTKSGTSENHGSGYYYGMAQALNARPLLSPENPVHRQNQYGLTAGGPMPWGRAFFFGNYEGQRRAESNKFSQVILSNLSSINAMRAAFGLRPEVSDLLKTNDYDQFLLKLDYQPDQKNTLTARYNLQKATVNGFLGGGGRASPASTTARNSDSLDQSLAVSEIALIRPRLVNEFRFQWARRSYSFDSVQKEPALEIPNLIIMGKSSSDLDFYHESRAEISDTINLSAGNHQSKIGFLFHRLEDQTIWGLFFPARIIFPTLNAFLSFRPISTSGPVNFWWPQLTTADSHPGFNVPFNDAVPSAWDSATVFDLTHSTYGFFGQDVWRLHRKWSLTYGLRYDFETYPSAYVSRKDLNNFQPRVGIAYSYNQSGFVRAGYGIFNDRIANSVGQVFAIPEWTSNGNLPNAAILFPDVAPIRGRFRQMNALGPAAVNATTMFLTTGQVPANGVSSLAGVLTSRLKSPYSEQASLEIGHDIGGVTATLSYLFVHAIGLPGQTPNLNALQTGTLPTGKPILAGRQFSDLGNFVVIKNLGDSIYHGGTFEVERLFRHGFGFHSSYTFSKTLSDVDATVSVADIPEGLTLERALSRQHVGHRFTLSFLTQAPRSFGVLRDFQLNSIVSLESGRFYTVFVGSDVNQDGNPNSDRPGVLGRNSLEGPGFATWDLRVGRTLHLNERWHAELTVDFFNLLNKTNIKDLNTVYGRSDLAQPPAPNLSFLAPRDAYNSRQIQYGIRVRF